jgi:hypothetical protein
MHRSSERRQDELDGFDAVVARLCRAFAAA